MKPSYLSLLGALITLLRDLGQRRTHRQRRQAIAGYFSNLHTALQHRYGVLPRYTPQQVRRTVQDTGHSQRFVEFAYLLHCGEQYFLEQGTEPAEIELLNTQLAADLQPVLNATSNSTAAVLDSSAIDVGLPDAGGITDV